MPTRRELFIGASATVAVGAAELFNEADRGVNGIQTPHATFRPLYVSHEIELPDDQLPFPMDAYFQEYTFLSDPFNQTPASILLAEVEGGDTLQPTLTRAFPDSRLRALGDHGTEIVLGDFGFDTLSNMTDQFNDILAAEGVLGGLVGFAALLSNRFTEGLSSSRRHLLKAGMYLASIWGVSPSLAWGIDVAGMQIDQQDAIKRLCARVMGIDYDFHPEEAVVFFRDLMMADKMLYMTEQRWGQTGRTQVMAFNTEGGHSGIEDMLLAGPKACRTLLSLYPTSFWRRALETTGMDIATFCSAAVIQLPAKIDQMGDLSTSTEFAALLPLQMGRITDDQLVRVLSEKLDV